MPNAPHIGSKEHLLSLLESYRKLCHSRQVMLLGAYEWTVTHGFRAGESATAELMIAVYTAEINLGYRVIEDLLELYAHAHAHEEN